MVGRMRPPSRDDVALAQEIADLRRRVEALAHKGQLANSSIEDGALTAFDRQGNVRQIIGLQPDGAITVTDHNGPPPPEPTAPIAAALVGQASVEWDGLFKEYRDADSGFFVRAPTPSDFKHVEVHASTSPGYEQTDATQVGTIVSRQGGRVTVALTADETWYISLQAVTTSGAQSTKSPEVAVTPIAVEDPVRFYQDTLVVPYGGYKDQRIDLTYLPVADSEHVYWNGQYQEGSRWSRPLDSNRVTVDDTAGLIQSGDRLTVEYAHREVPGVPNLDPLPFVRCAGVAMYGGLSNLPAGTEVGDTIIVATCGREKGYLTAGADQFSTEFRVGIGDADGSRVHVGVVKRLDKIGVMMGNQDGARSNHALVWTLRARLDGRFNQIGTTGVGQFSLEAPGEGSGFLAIMLNKGGIGGGYGGWNFQNGDNLAPWNPACSDGTYHNIASAWTPARSMPGGVLVTVRNNQWANAFVFGVRM